MSQPTVLEILNKTTQYLQEKGVENARSDSQWLLGRALGFQRLELYLNFDRPVSHEELAAYRQLVLRRAKREPLQHILGEIPFRELNLKVDRRALIPRQETELLVEIARKLWTGVEPPRILEIGVGTGAISLSLMREMPGAQVWGVEISRASLALARENAGHNDLPLAGRMMQGDALSAVRPGVFFDMVISNPPYVGRNELSQLAPEVREYDPDSALVGGPEGWEFPWALIENAHAHLRPGGILALEIGTGQAERLRDMASKMEWTSVEIFRDYQDVERFMAFVR